MSAAQLARIRWAVRAALALGVAASIAGNVLHAQDVLISQVIAAWSPIALLITIELIARVPVHHRGLAAARWLATAVIAGIAAWVSYWHMAAVASRFGEVGVSLYLLPLSVDGLIVVASICLVELGGRIRDAEAATSVRSVVHLPPAPVFDYGAPIGPEPELRQVDKLSTSQARERKAQPSSRVRVERAHRRTPSATNEELARRLELSTKTVARYRPERTPETAAEVDTEPKGREPQLANAE